MQDSLLKHIAVANAVFVGEPPKLDLIPNHKSDISDWKSWAHNKPGDCPCGISRKMCDYHR